MQALNQQFLFFGHSSNNDNLYLVFCSEVFDFVLQRLNEVKVSSRLIFFFQWLFNNKVCSSKKDFNVSILALDRMIWSLKSFRNVVFNRVWSGGLFQSYWYVVIEKIGIGLYISRNIGHLLNIDIQNMCIFRCGFNIKFYIYFIYYFVAAIN